MTKQSLPNINLLRHRQTLEPAYKKIKNFRLRHADMLNFHANI